MSLPIEIWAEINSYLDRKTCLALLRTSKADRRTRERYLWRFQESLSPLLALLPHALWTHLNTERLPREHYCCHCIRFASKSFQPGTHALTPDTIQRVKWLGSCMVRLTIPDQERCPLLANIAINALVYMRAQIHKPFLRPTEIICWETFNHTSWTAQHDNLFFGAILSACAVDRAYRIDIPTGFRSTEHFDRMASICREFRVSSPRGITTLWTNYSIWRNLTTLHVAEQGTALDVLYQDISPLSSVENFVFISKSRPPVNTSHNLANKLQWPNLKTISFRTPQHALKIFLEKFNTPSVNTIELATWQRVGGRTMRAVLNVSLVLTSIRLDVFEDGDVGGAPMDWDEEDYLTEEDLPPRSTLANLKLLSLEPIFLSTVTDDTIRTLELQNNSQDVAFHDLRGRSMDVLSCDINNLGQRRVRVLASNEDYVKLVPGTRSHEKLEKRCHTTGLGKLTHGDPPGTVHDNKAKGNPQASERAIARSELICFGVNRRREPRNAFHAQRANSRDQFICQRRDRFCMAVCEQGRISTSTPPVMDSSKPHRTIIEPSAKDVVEDQHHTPILAIISTVARGKRLAPDATSIDDETKQILSSLGGQMRELIVPCAKDCPFIIDIVKESLGFLRSQFETPLLRVACIKASRNNHDVEDYTPAKYNDDVYGKLLDICQIEVCKRIEIPEGVRSLRRLGSAQGNLRELHVTHPSPQLELWKQCAYWPNLTTLRLTERMPRIDYLYANISHIHSIETFELHCQFSAHGAQDSLKYTWPNLKTLTFYTLESIMQHFLGLFDTPSLEKIKFNSKSNVSGSTIHSIFKASTKLTSIGVCSTDQGNECTHLRGSTLTDNQSDTRDD
ncbi:hypothetical protein CPB83DRAFT_840884 [Crepidotus variabilis]|uniref:F-box domain-containing protein n=1 Tax=Crepidotus variabilis TaxID=179855 RepID=A0A9P6E3P8_9AGAR|nr:hypothetical protein CPB83DRAFT_840884 [Crepidotus variabilis]